jgi:hypothetical protein
LRIRIRFASQALPVARPCAGGHSPCGYIDRQHYFAQGAAMPSQISMLWALPAVLMAQLAAAQETDIAGKIPVELNAAQSVAEGCKLTFVVTNGLDTAIDALVYEAVLFDSAGQVEQLTLFDFGALPVARARVRQFVVPRLACEQLGRILFNGASTCAGANMAPSLCDTALVPSSRTTIALLG